MRPDNESSMRGLETGEEKGKKKRKEREKIAFYFTPSRPAPRGGGKKKEGEGRRGSREGLKLAILSSASYPTCARVRGERGGRGKEEKERREKRKSALHLIRHSSWYLLARDRERSSKKERKKKGGEGKEKSTSHYQLGRDGERGGAALSHSPTSMHLLAVHREKKGGEKKKRKKFAPILDAVFFRSLG